MKAFIYSDSEGIRNTIMAISKEREQASAGKEELDKAAAEAVATKAAAKPHPLSVSVFCLAVVMLW